MYNIAILGYGVVGSGVAEIVEKNSEGIKNRSGVTINVKKILDIRDFKGDRYENLITKNPDDIFKDDSIKLVVETIGGTGIAYELTKRALSSGKNVVTSNKELIATHGPELLSLANENDAFYLFEASVGGGIPIIRPLYNCLAANEIRSITGILNGTTNYILTSMKKDGKGFQEALREAQIKGYAESDPTADIEGHDACRKIAILSSIAYNRFVDYRKIETRGISNVSQDDFYYADLLGGTIKLIAESSRDEKGIYASVAPVIIGNSHPLSNVEDVFNAILVEGDVVGDAMFYGRGAGKLPTASAVVADIMDIVKKGCCEVHRLVWDKGSDAVILNNSKKMSKFYLRFENVTDKEKLKENIRKAFGEGQYYGHPDNEGQLVFITGFDTGYEVEKAVKRIEELGFKVSNVMKLML